MYNGHKLKHALKIQAITSPEGLCVHLHRPKVRRIHDLFLYAASRMDEMLPTIMTGNQYAVFGGAGYS